MFGLKDIWNLGCLEDYVKAQISNASVVCYGYLPRFFIYFIWWAHNLNILQDKINLVELVSNLIENMTHEFKCEPKRSIPFNPSMPTLDVDIPWSFFLWFLSRASPKMQSKHGSFLECIPLV
jgi:hypothetical protein